MKIYIFLEWNTLNLISFFFLVFFLGGVVVYCSAGRGGLFVVI